MITDALIDAFLATVGAVLGLAPETGLGGMDEAASANVTGFITAANGFLPISVAVVVLLALIALQLLLLSWDLLVWLYHQFWGSD